jgi:hypothetical protein
VENKDICEPQLSRVLDDFFGQLRFARAVDLASHGRTREAGSILLSNGARTLTAEELDLLARIVTKENRFAEARSFWNDAVRLDPKNRIYAECLEALTKAEGHKIRRIKFLVASVIIILVLLVCLWWIFAMPHRTPRHHPHIVSKPAQTPTVKPNIINTFKPPA